ncbi:MAG: MarR family transcriptional regulator [Candidatus Acidoferrum typicum]|nr:MarR family transcriptional regulator [Candidatus Acidoferrum typicum]
MSSRHAQHVSLPSEDRAFIALQKAADKLAVEAEQLMKSHGLTGAQYNVLRILRGAEPDGLACSSISERMISHDPDMTRLLDRMEKRHLITRQRQSDDRRVVKTRITSGGLELLKRLDMPVREMHKEQFAHMGNAGVKTLTNLLDEICVQDRA